MKSILLVLLILSMAAVVGSLLLGLVNLVRSGHDPARSNRLMRYRILFQAAALIVFALLMMLYKNG